MEQVSCKALTVYCVGYVSQYVWLLIIQAIMLSRGSCIMAFSLSLYIYNFLRLHPNFMDMPRVLLWVFDEIIVLLIKFCYH